MSYTESMSPAEKSASRESITLFVLLLTSVLLSGCVAAATGAAAGAAASESTPSPEVKKYVRTHDLEPRVARAIEGGYAVKGMKPEHVRLAIGEPEDVEESDGETVWIYDDSGVGKSRFHFQDGRLVDAPFVEQ
jgi:outer membrane lipoprotein-sorting protein